VSAQLRRLVARAETALEQAPAEDVLRWAAETFPGSFAVTASMGDTVLAHLASRVVPGLPVLFLDTGYHFPETLGTRDAVATTYDVALVTVRPELTVVEQDRRLGPRLHDRDPDLCCALRKVRPLSRALAGYTAWASGIRRGESASRAGTKVVAYEERRGKVKLSPLAGWSEDDVDAYARRHGIVRNPLLAEGYPSIGCAPCTSRVAPGEARRAGRWAGLVKTECGIHA